MALGGIWSRVTALLTGGAVAGAAADSVAPVLEAVKQHANAQRAIRVLEPGVAARAEAQRLGGPVDYADDAKRHGVGQARFAALVELESVAPGTAETLELWRRGKINEEQARHALHKSGLLEEFVEPVLELFGDRLDPAVVAVMVQRGILPNPGLLPFGPPTAAGKVPPMPGIDLDPVAEARASGIDKDRLAAMARIVGLPASPDLAARMVYRGIIERIDFDRAIAEGNTRNEWAPALFEGFREIPTVHTFVEARLRAWIDDAELAAGAELHGMSQTDAELLLKVQGRPLSWHQVFIGLRRGGVYDGPVDELDPAFLKALQESDIRPEWYSLAWAQRYNYPTAFVLRSLTSSGELTGAEAERILLLEGWEPELAHKVAQKWAGGRGGADWNETRSELAVEFEAGYITEAEYRAALEAHGLTGPALDRTVHLGDARRAKRHRERVVEAVRKAYVGFRLGDTAATSSLAGVHITGDAAAHELELWRLERLDTVRFLTVPELVKAFGKSLIDRTTALDELEHRGLSPADAVIRLDEG